MPYRESVETYPNGLISLANLKAALITDLLEPATNTAVPFANIEDTLQTTILEAKGIDPLWTALPAGIPSGFNINQNWRIALTINPTTNEFRMFWGTETQLPDVLAIDDVLAGEEIIPFVVLVHGDTIGRESQGGGSVNITQDVKTKYPWSYSLSTADRGFAMMFWAEGRENQVMSINTVDKGGATQDNTYQYSRVACIQRPTNTVNGVIKDNLKAPVFAIVSDLIPANAFNNETKLLPKLTPPGWVPGFKFGMVRDGETPVPDSALSNMNVPSETVLYTFDYEWHQPAMLDSFNHVIKFAFGMGTIRHTYLEEMDLLGLVFAGSFPAGQIADITLFDSDEARKYKAGPGNIGAVYLSRRPDDPQTGSPPNRWKAAQHQSRVVIVSNQDENGSDIGTYNIVQELTVHP